MDQSRCDVGVEDHHAHRGGRRDITGIVHVEHGHRGKLRLRRIEEHHGRNGRHGVNEQIDRDIEDRRQADRQRDAEKQLVERLLQ